MRVSDIYVEIGQLSSYVDESVQFYWDIISKDTIAEGAKLHFKRVPLELECNDCSTRFKPQEVSYECPGCHSSKVRVVAGEVFQLMGLDVEKGEPDRILEVSQ